MPRTLKGRLHKYVPSRTKNVERWQDAAGERGTADPRYLFKVLNEMPSRATFARGEGQGEGEGGRRLLSTPTPSQTSRLCSHPLSPSPFTPVPPAPPPLLLDLHRYVTSLPSPPTPSTTFFRVTPSPLTFQPLSPVTPFSPPFLLDPLQIVTPLLPPSHVAPPRPPPPPPPTPSSPPPPTAIHLLGTYCTIVICLSYVFFDSLHFVLW